jgi:hypothetical protein
VWEFLSSICIVFLCAFLAFGMAYVTGCVGILVSYIVCILYHMHWLGKASPIYIVQHGIICMSL